MNKRILMIITILLNLQYIVFAQKEAYKEALKYIKESKALKVLAEENLKIKDFDIYVSSEIIPFDLNTIIYSVIKTHYIADYTMFKKYSQEEENIINHVGDSLFKENTIMNEDYKYRNDEQLNKLTTGRQIYFVLFFSNIKKGKLYAEIVSYNKELHPDFKKTTVSFGKALTFLFELNRKNKINNVYQGEIYNN